MSLFKKFTAADISGHENLKNSVSRKIKNELIEAFPLLEDNLDDFFPKKETTVVYKTREKQQILCYKGEPIFFCDRTGPWYPTLRLVQQFPDAFPKLQVDRGAIPFVLKGAPIMSVGITSPGGKIFEPIEKETIVAIFAEDKEHPIAVGRTTISTEQMIKSGQGSGAGVENIHFMGDGLWHVTKV